MIEQRPILFIERPAHFWRNILGAFVTGSFFFILTFRCLIGGIALSERIEPNGSGS